MHHQGVGPTAPRGLETVPRTRGASNRLFYMWTYHTAHVARWRVTLYAACYACAKFVMQHFPCNMWQIAHGFSFCKIGAVRQTTGHESHTSCPMPHAPCPTVHVPCPVPHAPPNTPLPRAVCPMPRTRVPHAPCALASVRHPCIHESVHPSVHLSIRPSVRSPARPPVFFCLSFGRCVVRSTRRSVRPSVGPSVHSCVSCFINLLRPHIVQLVNAPVCPSTRPSTRPSVHPSPCRPINFLNGQVLRWHPLHVRVVLPHRQNNERQHLLGRRCHCRALLRSNASSASP